MTVGLRHPARWETGARRGFQNGEPMRDVLSTWAYNEAIRHLQLTAMVKWGPKRRTDMRSPDQILNFLQQEFRQRRPGREATSVTEAIDALIKARIQEYMEANSIGCGGERLQHGEWPTRTVVLPSKPETG